MAMARVIKRNDGVIQVQHRVDEVYDDTTLPPETVPADVADQVVVDVTMLADVDEPQSQVDVVAGALTKDLTQQTITQEVKAKWDAAQTVLAGMDADVNVSEDVKVYIRAVCDILNVGPNRITRPQATTTRP